MTKMLCVLVAVITLGAYGCESVHETARDVGRPAGSAARLPGSVMEGAAEGVAGQPNPNPYGR